MLGLNRIPNYLFFKWAIFCLANEQVPHNSSVLQSLCDLERVILIGAANRSTYDFSAEPGVGETLR